MSPVAGTRLVPDPMPPAHFGAGEVPAAAPPTRAAGPGPDGG
jgi:hypothetical protein